MNTLRTWFKVFTRTFFS